MTINKIRDLLTSEIKPFIENDEKNKLAAVLIIIYGKIPKILMTKKPITMSQHGGEISFPGGKISDSDNTLLDLSLIHI